MAGAFEVATRSAINEIIVDAVQESKFGYVMSHEALQQITDQLFDLFITSRNLKAAGDRMIAQGLVPGMNPAAAKKPKPRF
ncbi:MAG TPA: hypothetical protein VE954_16285 [Oligoflexus sp.]|uniref:hypothetical protein n=1 Tax=Oligoflexus sp. TaxID=1971216 RepID=UPI002D5798CB|nr:hypothetical protein [Oligoflexus sp.]HYX34659.1 hypothetical protein [Oligoflexus sp.]